MTKQLAIGLAVIGVFLTVAAASGAFAVYGYKAAKEAEANTAKMLYNVDVSATVKVMEEKMAYLEYVDIMQAAVWYNAIYEERDAKTDAFTTVETVTHAPYLGTLKGRDFVDFNTALRNLYRDETFIKRHLEAQASVDVFKNEVSKLHDYPAGCEKTHDAFVDLYKAYAAYADIVLDPEGSYTTYTANALSAKQELQKQFSIMETYITTTEE